MLGPILNLGVVSFFVGGVLARGGVVTIGGEGMGRGAGDAGEGGPAVGDGGDIG